MIERSDGRNRAVHVVVEEEYNMMERSNVHQLLLLDELRPAENEPKIPKLIFFAVRKVVLHS